MKSNEFRIDGFYTMWNYGGLEVMIEDEDGVRYRAVFSEEDKSRARVSRRCKIYTTPNGGRAFFKFGSMRIYLDEVMRVNY